MNKDVAVTTRIISTLLHGDIFDFPFHRNRFAGMAYMCIILTRMQAYKYMKYNKPASALYWILFAKRKNSLSLCVTTQNFHFHFTYMVGWHCCTVPTAEKKEKKIGKRESYLPSSVQIPRVYTGVCWSMSSVLHEHSEALFSRTFLCYCCFWNGIWARVEGVSGGWWRRQTSARYGKWIEVVLVLLHFTSLHFTTTTHPLPVFLDSILSAPTTFGSIHRLCVIVIIFFCRCWSLRHKRTPSANHAMDK